MDFIKDNDNCKNEIITHAKSGALIGGGIGVLYGVATAGMKMSGGNNIINNMITHGLNKGVFGCTLMAVYAGTKFCAMKKDSSEELMKEIGEKTKGMMGFMKNITKDDKEAVEVVKDVEEKAFGFLKSFGKDKDKNDTKEILEFVKNIGKDDK